MVGAAWGVLVPYSIKRLTFDWKVASSNPGLVGPSGAISIVSPLCAVRVFMNRHGSEAPSQLPNGSGLLI